MVNGDSTFFLFTYQLPFKHGSQNQEPLAATVAKRGIIRKTARNMLVFGAKSVAFVEGRIFG